MKTANRIAMIYGVSLLGAGAVSFYRGRRGTELLRDAALHGAVTGTALNVVGWLVLESGEKIPMFAATNSEGGLGKTPKKVIALLNTIDNDALFADLKENGVKVAEAPKNASIVMQDAD